MNRKYISFLAAAGILLSLMVAVPAFAQTNNGVGNGGRFGRGMIGKGQSPIVVGTVSAVNGNTITVNGRQGFNSTVTTSFTVNITSATKIIKAGISSPTISNIAQGDTVLVQGALSGTTITATSIRDGVVLPGQRGEMGISGKVTANDGTTLTVTGRAKSVSAAPVYTITAGASATITKNGQAVSLSGISINDMVMVQGSVGSNNSIVATVIRDGAPQSPIQGNGQPVVAGVVTSATGVNPIVITNKSNVTYTVDASSAKFVVSGVANPTISNIATGDNLTIQGTINGNNVTASSVIDQKAKSNSNEGNQKSGFVIMGGMMNGIGNFFKRLFGF